MSQGFKIRVEPTLRSPLRTPHSSNLRVSKVLSQNLTQKISTLNIFFEFRRFKPFVDLTLYTPIYVLLILLPLGVLIPGEASEIALGITSSFSSIRRKNGISNNTFISNILLCRLFPGQYAYVFRLVSPLFEVRTMI